VIVPLPVSGDDTLLLLIADYAYQSKAGPVQNADIKNLEAFARLATLAYRVELVRGKLSDDLRQREWDQFVRETTHEITSEVSKAGYNAGVIRDRAVALGLDDIREEVNAIRARHTRVMEAAKRVWEYTRPMGTFNRLDLDGIIREVISVDRSIGYSYESREPAYVSGSAGRLKEALSNVINNAIDAGRKNGRNPHIQIRLRGIAREERKYWNVEISDKAGGMPQEIAANILRGNYSTIVGDGSTKGDPLHGLGLPIVKKVMLGHGGLLEICPNEIGTDVILSVPALDEVGELQNENSAAG